MQQKQAQLTFQHFEQLIGLLKLLTGEKPQSITLSPDVYDWYVQEAQIHADELGLSLGFRSDPPEFLKVKLLKRPPKIETGKTPLDEPVSK